jgi:uncharacterized membrane protein
MSDAGGTASAGEEEPGDSLTGLLSDIVIKGLTVIFPFVVTIWVLKTAFGIVTDALTPVVAALEWAGVVQWVEQNGFIAFLIEVGLFSDVAAFTAQIVAVFGLVFVVLVAGTIANMRYGDHLIDFFDYFIGAIPGIGTVYHSFRKMGDAMLESDVENFRSVKLIEFPHDGIFVIGFETAQSPPTVGKAAGEPEEGMITMFLPLAPNPVMGGFLTHIPEDRVRDVDMTVEEGVRSIITSGMATGANAQDEEDEELDPGEAISDLGVTTEDLPSLSDRFDQDGENGGEEATEAETDAGAGTATGTDEAAESVDAGGDERNRTAGDGGS